MAVPSPQSLPSPPTTNKAQWELRPSPQLVLLESMNSTHRSPEYGGLCTPSQVKTTASSALQIPRIFRAIPLLYSYNALLLPKHPYSTTLLLQKTIILNTNIQLFIMHHAQCSASSFLLLQNDTDHEPLRNSRLINIHPQNLVNLPQPVDHRIAVNK